MEGDHEYEGVEEVVPVFQPRPRRPLNVMLANPRENGVVEFLAAIREGNLDEVRTTKLNI